MKVIKHTISTGKSIKTDYPAKWPNELIGLSSDLEYYEIKYSDKPEYNANQYYCNENIVLTDDQGEVLKIALIEWEFEEIPEETVVLNMNDGFGVFIGDSYPLWQRIKDYSNPSDNGDLRKTQEQELRTERENRENEYINNNVFPSFDWEWIKI